MKKLKQFIHDEPLTATMVGLLAVSVIVAVAHEVGYITRSFK